VNDWLQVVANEAPSVHFLDCSLQFLVPGPTSEIEISSMLMKDFYHLTVKVRRDPTHSPQRCFSLPRNHASVGLNASLSTTSPCEHTRVHSLSTCQS
jgi:hypothetical protein